MEPPGHFVGESTLFIHLPDSRPLNRGIDVHRMLIDLRTEWVRGVGSVWTNPIREGVSVEGLAVIMVQIVGSRLNRCIWVQRPLKDMEHAAIPGTTLWVFPGNAEWLPVQVLEVEALEMWEDGKELCVEREVMVGEVVGLQECTQVDCIGKGIKVNVNGDRVWESRSVDQQCGKVVKGDETI